MKGLKYRIAAGFLLLFIHHLSAQFQPRNLIRHWNIKDGLSQGVVNSISQDNQSLMWFATEDGLNRFDGYSFKVFRYDPENKNSIADNFVQSVFKDSEGILWTSSRKGLLQFDPYTETFHNYFHEFKKKSAYASNDVSYITEGKNGNLWIAWYGRGFASFNKSKKTFAPYVLDNLPGIKSEKTVALLEDNYGLLWVGTQDGGANVFQVRRGVIDKKLENLSSPVHLPSLNVHCFAEDKYGNVWIGSSRGLVVYIRKENNFFSFDKNFSVAGLNIMSLLADAEDNLWIGTQGSGLFQLDLRQFNTRIPGDFLFSRIKSLNEFDVSKRTIQCIYQDKDKNVWIGTFGDGAYLVSSVKENFIKIQKPIYDNSAVSYVAYYGMCYDQEGNLWLGTDGNGIFKSDLYGNTIRHYTVENARCALKDNAILSALHDDKDRLWFGSYSHGVFAYNKQTDSFVNYRYQNGAQLKAGANDVRVIFQDSKDNIWIGTNRGGLCLLNLKDRSYSNLPEFQGAFLSGDVRSITEDKSGRLWVGFYGDGLYSYDPRSKNATRHFNDLEKGTDQLKNDIVFALKTDQRGHLWIGTGGGGLYMFDSNENKLNRYTEKDGIANNTIYSILIDNNENIWISTNSGISKLAAQKNEFFNFDVSDGLQEGQFNPGSALYNSVGGYVCVGGTLGLNIFYPDQVKTNLMRPEIMISGLSLFNKAIKINDSTDGDPVLKQVISRTKEVTLEHDQNVLTFDFVGINYSYPDKNIYAYKLDGLDEDWNYVGNHRSATYRYLKPGEYTFKVKASISENDWSNEYSTVLLTINPPIWRTPFAYLVYALIAAGVTMTIVVSSRRQLQLRRRLKIEKSQRKHERQLVQQKLSFFTEISHEFKTPLTLMIGPLEEILSTEDRETPAYRKLKMVYRNAHKLLNLINKLLDYRKIESGNILLKTREGNIVSFVEEICQTFQELANHRKIDFQFETDDKDHRLFFDREKLEMVLDNIISNSFKYIGKGNKISVHVSKQVSDRYPQGRIVIKIRDNGVGIQKKHLGNIFDWFYKGDTFGTMSTGIGLALAKKLVHLHKGEIFVESVEGQGSVFSIKLPMGKDHLKPEEIVTAPESEKHLLLNNPEVVKENPFLLEKDEDAMHKKGLKSLLLIEDDDEIRLFLKEFFEKQYRIFEASNGKEGFDTTLNSHPDLIISDVMMPEMDGIEFCRNIKNNIRTSHIPVILLTAKSSLTHHKEGIVTGADAYITKPFSPEILDLTVHNLLQTRENLMRFYRNLFTSDSVHANEAKGQVNALDEKFLHSIYDRLKANLDKPDFNINELCDELNMSRSLVYKKIKMLTGLSPVEYIRSLRMQEAAKLLKTKQYKVFEVVYMVGFTDLKYFRQCFAKEFGYSPSEFIKQPEPE